MSSNNKDFLNVLRYLTCEDEQSANDLFQSRIKFLSNSFFSSSVVAHILPLLYFKLLKAGDFAQLCERSQSCLKLSHTKSIVSQMLKVTLSKEIAAKLSDQNIRFILLKGMAFNLNIYPADCPRMSADLDILVRKKERETTRLALEGFMVKLSPKANNKFDGLYEDSYSYKNKPGPTLDKHFYLAYPALFPVDENLLWQSSKPHPYFRSDNIRELCAEHHLIHLAIHCLKDQSFYNHHLLDAFYLMNIDNIDYQKAFEHAREWNASYALYFFLSICDSVFNTNLKIQKFAPFSPSWLRKRLGWVLINYVHKIPYVEKGILHRLIQASSQLLLCNNIKLTLRHFRTFLFR